MKFSRAAKAGVLLVVLLLTLTWKLAVRFSDPGEPPREQSSQDVANFLRRQHFNVTVMARERTALQTVRATSGNCQIVVTEAGFEGFHEDSIRRTARPDEVVFVVFGGRMYAKQPTWRTVADYLSYKIKRELGLRAERTLALFVVAGRECEAQKLPWDQLR